jgi:hypothetical protein
MPETAMPGVLKPGLMVVILWQIEPNSHCRKGIPMPGIPMPRSAA